MARCTRAASYGGELSLVAPSRSVNAMYPTVNREHVLRVPSWRGVASGGQREAFLWCGCPRRAASSCAALASENERVQHDIFRRRDDDACTKLCFGSSLSWTTPTFFPHRRPTGPATLGASSRSRQRHVCTSSRSHGPCAIDSMDQGARRAHSQADNEETGEQGRKRRRRNSVSTEGEGK